MFERHSTEKKRRGKKRRHDEVEAIQENQLRVFREVLDLRVVGREVALAGNPADVRPPETVDMRRMRVGVFIGVLVMMPMMVGPPKRSALHGRAGKHRQEKLADARSLVSFVRKIA